MENAVSSSRGVNYDGRGAASLLRFLESRERSATISILRSCATAGCCFRSPHRSPPQRSSQPTCSRAFCCSCRYSPAWSSRKHCWRSMALRWRRCTSSARTTIHGRELQITTKALVAISAAASFLSAAAPWLGQTFVMRLLASFIVKLLRAVCKKLLQILSSVGIAENAWLDIVVARDDLTEHRVFVAQCRLQNSPRELSKELGIAFRGSRLPYGALVVGAGVVRAKRLINNRQQFASLLDGCDLRVALVQYYLSVVRSTHSRPTIVELDVEHPHQQAIDACDRGSEAAFRRSAQAGRAPLALSPMVKSLVDGAALPFDRCGRAASP